ncbi:MAG TPA: orotate phosphoribosyltransferase [Thermoanaerobacterales bacterium]|nr:orotate phosphoribosyltransferase [Thermoanaerobacterales bacterium]
MNNEQALQIFKKTGGYLEGHFLFTSGRHGDCYMQCAKVLQYPEYTFQFGAVIAEYFKDKGVSAVIGPAVGGIVIAYEVARQLGVRALFAERENGIMTIRRGLEINPGEKLLIVEDVVTTGGSVKEVMEIVRENKGIAAGVGAVVDRTGGTIEFGVPFKAALTLKLNSYPPEQCPICKGGDIPLIKPGSRNI